MSLSLLRHLSEFPTDTQSRMIIDANGDNVSIPSSLHGIIGHALGFLPMTHKPELLYKGGGSLERKIFSWYIISWLYPEVLQNDALWDSPNNLEVLLSYDRHIVVLNNVYFGGIVFGSSQLRHFGINAVSSTPKTENDNEIISTNAHVFNNIIGQPEFAKKLLDRYHDEFETLNLELQPWKIKDRPTILGMGAPANNWSRLFVTSIDEAKQERLAVKSPSRKNLALGRQQDPERVLAIDPDIIMLLGTDREEFVHDPRWKGLKAVQNNRIYENSIKISSSRYDIDNLPIGARWIAEIAHPNELQPKLREIIKEHYQNAYNYTINNTQIDEILLIDKNKNATGYTRFVQKNRNEEK